jgi:hypothetical protein
MDVNADGTVSSKDALVVINTINRRDNLIARVPSNSFPDVDGDRLLNPRDAFLIIDHLNQLSSQANATRFYGPLRASTDAGARQLKSPEHRSDHAAGMADFNQPEAVGTAGDSRSTNSNGSEGRQSPGPNVGPSQAAHPNRRTTAIPISPFIASGNSLRTSLQAAHRNTSPLSKNGSASLNSAGTVSASPTLTMTAEPEYVGAAPITVGAIPDIVAYETDPAVDINLEYIFFDIDLDIATYEIVTPPMTFAPAIASGPTLTVGQFPPGAQGSGAVTVRATDGQEASTEASGNVEVHLIDNTATVEEFGLLYDSGLSGGDDKSTDYRFTGKVNADLKHVNVTIEFDTSGPPTSPLGFDEAPDFYSNVKPDGTFLTQPVCNNSVGPACWMTWGYYRAHGQAPGKTDYYGPWTLFSFEVLHDPPEPMSQGSIAVVENSGNGFVLKGSVSGQRSARRHFRD